MNSTTSISRRIRKTSRTFLSRLMAIFTLQAFVLAMTISTAIADMPLHDVHPEWEFPPPPNATITANYVATMLLPQLIGSDDQLRQRLGFSSLAQISSLDSPDRPFAVFRLGLSRLKNFDPLTTSPLSLLLEDENWASASPSPLSPPRVIPGRFLFLIRESYRPASGCAYPSLIDVPTAGCVASSVQVKLLSDKWEFQQIGRRGLARKLTKFGNGGTDFVVWIPGLNLHYLARRAGTDLMITAIAKDRYVKKNPAGEPFDAGNKLSGMEVFKQLKQVVQSIDPDDPPG